MAAQLAWVSDRLHEILGLSDRQVAEFMIELANKAKSPEELTRKLQSSAAVQINPEVEVFAAELWTRCAGGGAGEDREEEKRGLKRPLPPDDGGTRSRKSSRHIRSQRATEVESDEEDDVRSPVQVAEDSDSDEWERYSTLLHIMLCSRWYCLCIRIR